MKILYLDTETGGVDSRENSLIQIGGIIVENGVELERFNIKIKPNPNLITSIEALEVQGRTMELINQDNTFISEKEAFTKFKKILDKYVPFGVDIKDKLLIVGYNVNFDVEFIDAFCKRYAFPYFRSKINSSLQDPLYLLGNLQLRGMLPILKNNKLETWMEYFKLGKQDHDAWSDIKATRELYKIINGMLDGLSKYDEFNLLKNKNKEELVR